MREEIEVDRRSVLKAALAAPTAGALVAAGTTASAGESGSKPDIRFRNEQFLTDGKFDAEKAKDAVEALCRYHGYPIFPQMRDNLWVSDYGIGKFAELGLAACVFVNNVKDRYMMLDIYLLPGQMLPEHWHVEAEGNPAKMEGWLVRWGLSHIVGIGEPNLTSDVRIPACHAPVTTRHAIAATPGTFVPLAENGSRHWQYGGPEGAIVTEVANVHTNSGVRHTDPVLNKYFLDNS